MSGFFGVCSNADCTGDLFFGTDYHSHLGTQRGGMAVLNKKKFNRYIHDIRNTPFRTKFENDISKLHGNKGIGIISDYEDQPVLIRSHLGEYAIATVGAIQNAEELTKRAFRAKTTHFSEMNLGTVNPTELVATLINREETFESGIKRAMEDIKGSCSMLILTETGIYAARDKLGRTPVILGKKEGAFAAVSETCAFPNLNYDIEKYLGPGEIIHFTEKGYDVLQPPGEKMQICAFLWVYYGYPASTYESINVENTRYRCGAELAKNDDTEIDVVAGIPDSGTAHAIGYANHIQAPYMRPFVKYTPTWPRSFMPQDQKFRELVAKMKLIPIRELISGRRLMFCEDSIVRGTQLQDIIHRIYDYGAKEVHMRPACPPLVFGCPYLNFSRSRSVMDMAARRAIKEIEGGSHDHFEDYIDTKSGKYTRMIEQIRKRLNLTSLKYQQLDNMIHAIGLPKSKLCTYCWDGCGEC